MVNAESFLFMVICGFFSLTISDTKFFNLSLWLLIGAVLETLCIWLGFCYVGDLFYTMNGLIFEEIYCSPWYHLGSKDRRLILTFLSILQRPISIRPLGIYLVNLSLFPGTVNNVYSHVQILRKLQFNKRRS